MFGELWDEMACKITGSDVQKSCPLWYAVKEERTLEDLKVLEHNQKMGVQIGQDVTAQEVPVVLRRARTRQGSLGRPRGNGVHKIQMAYDP